MYDEYVKLFNTPVVLNRCSAAAQELRERTVSVLAKLTNNNSFVRIFQHRIYASLASQY